jgi:hypothetical protein
LTNLPDASNSSTAGAAFARCSAGVARPVDDPDVVASVDGHRRDVAEELPAGMEGNAGSTSNFGTRVCDPVAGVATAAISTPIRRSPLVDSYRPPGANLTTPG